MVCAGNGDESSRAARATTSSSARTAPTTSSATRAIERLDGGNGVDRLSGDSGNDTISGENGGDELEGGTGLDALDGGNGPDTCANRRDVRRLRERAGDARPARGTRRRSAGDSCAPRRARASGSRSIRTGGIRPWDLQVDVDPVAMRTVRDALASPAYDFKVPPGTAAVHSAPGSRSRTTRVAARRFPEGELRIKTFDEHPGLWLVAGDDQVVDNGERHRHGDVTHFSVYAVLKLDERAGLVTGRALRHVASRSTTPGDPTRSPSTSPSCSTSPGA